MIQKELDAIYYVCKKEFSHSYEHLKETNDDKLFLVDSLYCELCSNAISLCIELSCDLTNSSAMETSCRSIMEAIILLRMVFGDEIDESQIANYLHQSAALFYGNIFDTAKDEKDRVLDDEESDLMKSKINWIVSDYEAAIAAFKEKYGDKMGERETMAAAREGLFFTRKNPRRGKSFTDLFNNHMKEVDESGSMYKRVSFFAHPWYLDDYEDFDLVRSVRLKDVMHCLDMVQQIFAEELKEAPCADGIMESDLNSLGVHLERSQEIENICSEVSSFTAANKEALPFTTVCFAFLRDILTEMNIMNGLGYPEIALSKFQTVCEFWSMNALLHSQKTPKQMECLHRAFDFSTRIQIRNLGGFDDLQLRDREVLKNAFDGLFEHPTITFEEYEKNVSTNSLLFLYEDVLEKKPSLIDVVYQGLDIAFAPSHCKRRKDFILSYLFSIDVHHATGFCYTENRDCWLFLSHAGLRGIYCSIWSFLLLLCLPPDEDKSYAPYLKRIEELIKIEQEELLDLDWKYPE